MPRHVFASLLVLATLWPSGGALADDAPTFADRADDTLEDADLSTAFVLSPLAMACGVFGAEADVVVHRSMALAFQANAYQRQGMTSGAVAAGLMVYPLRSAFHGLYFAPRVAYTQSLSEKLVPGAAAAVLASLTGGWQWTWDYGLSLRLGGGVAEGVVLADGKLGAPGALSPLAPAIGLGPLALLTDAGLGWAW